jgi:hypothetical protein
MLIQSFMSMKESQVSKYIKITKSYEDETDANYLNYKYRNS